MEGGSFDQILDLGSMPDSNKAEMDDLMGLPKPIIAFEESITQQNNTLGNEKSSESEQNLDSRYPSEILCRGEVSILLAAQNGGWSTLEMAVMQNYF